MKYALFKDIEGNMNYLISIDDTDDVTKAVSTGKIAELIGDRLSQEGGRILDGISRHQLLLSDRIAYTSHNSAMCIEVALENIGSDRIAEVCEETIKKNMARVSDPGLAICSLGSISDPARLIEFGFEAKHQIKTKTEAYALAASTDGVFLKELGGSGSGIIGALAGIGLRLSRSDGSLRGKCGEHLRGMTVTAADICRDYGADMVVCTDGTVIGGDTKIFVKEFIKLMYFDGQKCCIVRLQEDGSYVTIHQHQEREKFLKIIGQAVCGSFVHDNDEEEYILSQGTQSCFNCLYRRWMKGGFECMKKDTM